MKNFKSLTKIALVLLTLLATISCSKKNNPVQEPEKPVEVIPEDFTPPADFAGMSEALKGRAKAYGAIPTSPKTSFVPNDNTPIIKIGESVTSPNGNYRLTIKQDNGELVLYKKVNVNAEEEIWSSKTVEGKSLFFQTDGNLVLYKGDALYSPVSWASSTDAGLGLNKLTGDMTIYALQDDGDFAMYWKHNPAGKTPRKWTLSSTDTKGGIVSEHKGNMDQIEK